MALVLSCLLLAACTRPNTPAPDPKHTQPAPSPAAPQPPAAESDAISYRGTGTEPFWGMTLTERELRITFPEPEPSIATPYTATEHDGERILKSAALHATVTFKTCSDGMSDRVYPHTVKVVIGERILNGCGWPAGHDLGPAP